METSNLSITQLNKLAKSSDDILRQTAFTELASRRKTIHSQYLMDKQHSRGFTKCPRCGTKKEIYSYREHAHRCDYCLEEFETSPFKVIII